MIKLFRNLPSRQQGIALFVSVLISMSLAVIALASMSRLTEATHQTGKSLQDRKLNIYAESAAYIVSAELEETINAEIDFAPVYYIHGPEGMAAFKYYPRDITINPGSSGHPTLFGYRAQARLFASEGSTPPGYPASMQLSSNSVCYDIVIDVREVLNLPSGSIYRDENSKTDVARYYLGKSKTIGIISCFNKG